MRSKNLNLSIMHKLSLVMLMMSITIIGLFVSQLFTIRQNYEVSQNIEKVNRLTKELLYVDMEEKNFMSLQDKNYLTNAEGYLVKIEAEYVVLEQAMGEVAEFQQMKEIIDQYKKYHREIAQNHQLLEDTLLKLNVEYANSLAVIEKLSAQTQLQKEALMEKGSYEQAIAKADELVQAKEMIRLFQELHILQLEYLNSGEQELVLALDDKTVTMVEELKTFQNQISSMINRGQIDVILDSLSNYQNSLHDFESSKRNLIESEKGLTLVSEKTISFSDKMEKRLAQTANNNQREAVNMAVFMVLLGIVCILISFIIVVYSVKRPLQKVKQEMDFATQNRDLTKVIQLRNKDELSEVVGSFNLFSQTIRGVVEGIIHSVSRLNLTSDDLRHDAGQLHESVDDMQKRMLKANEELHRSSDDISNMTEILMMLEDEMTKISEKSSAYALEAQKDRKKAEDEMVFIHQQQQKSHEKFLETRDLLKKSLHEVEVVQEISQLAESIRTISKQTHLLALNAGIEAARAGESGRGFQVVAEAIRELSQNTQSIISRIQNLTDSVIESVRSLANSSNEVLSFVEEEQSRNEEEFERLGEGYTQTTQAYRINLLDFENEMLQMVKEVRDVSAGLQNISAVVSLTMDEFDEMKEYVLKIQEVALDVNGLAKTAREEALILDTHASEFQCAPMEEPSELAS